MAIFLAPESIIMSMENKDKKRTPLGQRIEDRLTELKKSQGDLAEEIGTGQSAISQLMSGLIARSKHLPEIADALNVNLEWLLHERGPKEKHEKALSPPQFPKEFIPVSAPLQRRKVPVYGPASAAAPDSIFITEEFIVDRISCPEELVDVREGFVMSIAGNSMYPRYKHGEMVSVHPYRPPYVGQDCVAVLEEDGKAIVKEFAGGTATEWRFKQYNPEQMLKFKKTEVRAIYAIVGRPV